MDANGPPNFYRLLIGDGKTDTRTSRKKKRSVNPDKICPPESYEQKLLATWLTKKGILFYHCPNGGLRDKVTAMSLKAIGLSPGVPDICVPIARKGKHGLYIELKRKIGGTVSIAQRYWLDQLAKEGYMAIVAKGFDEAKNIVEDYLK